MVYNLDIVFRPAGATMLDTTAIVAFSFSLPVVSNLASYNVKQPIFRTKSGDIAPNRQMRTDYPHTFHYKMREVTQTWPGDPAAHAQEKLTCHYLRACPIADKASVKRPVETIMAENIERQPMIRSVAMPLHHRSDMTEMNRVTAAEERAMDAAVLTVTSFLVAVVVPVTGPIEDFVDLRTVWAQLVAWHALLEQAQEVSPLCLVILQRLPGLKANHVANVAVGEDKGCASSQRQFRSDLLDDFIGK